MQHNIICKCLISPALNDKQPYYKINGQLTNSYYKFRRRLDFPTRKQRTMFGSIDPPRNFTQADA